MDNREVLNSVSNGDFIKVEYRGDKLDVINVYVTIINNYEKFYKLIEGKILLNDKVINTTNCLLYKNETNDECLLNNKLVKIYKVS